MEQVGGCIFFIAFLVIVVFLANKLSSWNKANRDAIKAKQAAIDSDKKILLWKQALDQRASEDIRKKRAEERLEKRVDKFKSGDGFNIIQRFAEKFEPEAGTNEFKNLTEVLRLGGHYFSEEQILHFLRVERKRQKLSSVKISF